jgi:hypothetical protein
MASPLAIKCLIDEHRSESGIRRRERSHRIQASAMTSGMMSVPPLLQYSLANAYRIKREAAPTQSACGGGLVDASILHFLPNSSGADTIVRCLPPFIRLGVTALKLPAECRLASTEISCTNKRHHLTRRLNNR